MKAIVYHLWNKTVYIFGLFIVLFAMPQIGYGQVSNYAFTETTGTYQAILGNSSLGGWSGTGNGTNNPPGSTTPTHMILPIFVWVVNLSLQELEFQWIIMDG